MNQITVAAGSVATGTVDSQDLVKTLSGLPEELCEKRLVPHVNRMAQLVGRFFAGWADAAEHCQFEHDLQGTLREAGRVTMEYTCNAAEPQDKREVPPRVRIGRREFRRNRKTPSTVGTLFGPIVLRRTIYQAVEPGEPGLAPLERGLGIVARVATPALGDAAWLNADLTQQQTPQVLEGRHGVKWSHGTLRKVVCGDGAVLRAAATSGASGPAGGIAEKGREISRQTRAHAQRGTRRRDRPDAAVLGGSEHGDGECAGPSRQATEDDLPGPDCHSLDRER